MIDNNHSTDGDKETPKKLNLNALVPTKGSITTSIGILYTRHPYSSDWKDFDLEDSVELGRIAVQRLCNRIEDKNDSSALHDDDLKLLTNADCQELVKAIAKQSGWRELPDKSGLKELGELIKEKKQALTEQHEKMLGALRKSIGSSYSFLGKGALEKLQEQMAGIANIRSSLAGMESLHAALRATALPDDSWRKSLAEMNALDKATPNFNAGRLATQINSPGIYDLPKPIIPPRFEETPMGRATLENLENSRQVAKQMDDLVVVVAGLNQTLVQNILPAWIEKIEKDQKDSESAFNQAASGLRWTKWAVIASVFATLAATWWQVDIAKSIDSENSEQQKHVEAILREQLAAQQQLIEQQAKDAAAVREVIVTLKQQILIGKPNRRSGS